MIVSGQATVGTATPVQIGIASSNASLLHIANVDNTKTIYLGGLAVTSTTGYALFKLERIELDLQPGEALYAISAGSDHVITWLQQVL